jgi:hypothetical protein
MTVRALRKALNRFKAGDTVLVVSDVVEIIDIGADSPNRIVSKVIHGNFTVSRPSIKIAAALGAKVASKAIIIEQTMGDIHAADQ